MVVAEEIIYDSTNVLHSTHLGFALLWRKKIALCGGTAKRSAADPPAVGGTRARPPQQQLLGSPVHVQASMSSSI